MGTPIICCSCHATGSVGQVTAALRCYACGSDDLDLYQPADLGSRSFTAAMGVEANSGGTGWGKPMPDPLKGWGDYAGPMPGANPFHAPTGPKRCPNCKGSGYDLLDRGKCRACQGSGTHRSPTSVEPEPLVARHPGQTKTPFVGRRRREGGRKSSDPLGSPEDHIRATTPGYTDRGYRWEPDSDGMFPRSDNMSPHVKTRPDRDYSQGMGKPLQLDAADCPECGHAPTHLVKDHKEDAWWHCPNCGPLVNIDRKPDVNPFDHDTYPGRQKGFKTEGGRGHKKTGRVYQMCTAVARSNPGMTQQEVLGLVRRTVRKYSE